MKGAAMARIRHVDMPRDLFGDVARGVSIPRILWETYYEIVRLVISTFGKSLERVTSKVLADSFGSMSMVARRTNLLTVLVTEVHEKDVAFILSFDDLRGTELERNVVLNEIVRRARLRPLLQVDAGELIGCVTMERPINVILLQDRSTLVEEWPRWKRGHNVEAEIRFINEKRLLRN